MRAYTSCSWVFGVRDTKSSYINLRNRICTYTYGDPLLNEPFGKVALNRKVLNVNKFLFHNLDQEILFHSLTKYDNICTTQPGFIHLIQTRKYKVWNGGMRAHRPQEKFRSFFRQQDHGDQFLSGCFDYLLRGHAITKQYYADLILKISNMSTNFSFFGTQVVLSGFHFLPIYEPIQGFLNGTPQNAVYPRAVNIGLSATHNFYPLLDRLPTSNTGTKQTNDHFVRTLR